MKKTTCAVVIINKEGDILGCHSMGSVTYDFPKGCVEPGESDIDAAVRELKEEGIFSSYIVVSREEIPRMLSDGILVLPWKEFLMKLWNGEIYGSKS